MSRQNRSKRAVAYVRRSSEKQDTSLPQQIDWAERTARTRSLTLHLPSEPAGLIDTAGICFSDDLYWDDAVSGAVESRQGLLALMRRIKEDASIAYLLVWDRSRLGRFERSEVGMALERDILEVGVTIVMQRGDLAPKLISDGPQYEDLASSADWIGCARMRVDLAENTLRGLRRSAEAGFWCGGSPPYGFVRMAFDNKTNTVGDVLQANRGIRDASGESVVVLPGSDPENKNKLEVVRFITKEYAQGLSGLHAIAKMLNERGVPSPYAGRRRRQRDGTEREVWGKWTVNSVRGILENPIYSAKLAWGRREYGSVRRYSLKSDSGFRKVENHERKRTGTRKAIAKEHRDPEEWLLVDPAVKFDAVVPYGLFQANMKMLKDKAQRGGLRGKPKCSNPNKYPLAVYCGDCGQRMAGTNQGQHPVWMCSRFINSHRTECHNNWVSRDDVVVFAMEKVRRKINGLGDRTRLKSEIARVLAEHRTAQSDLEKAIATSGRQRKDLMRQAEQAYGDHLTARSEVERVLTKKAYDEVHEKLTQVERQLRRHEADLALNGIGGEDQITDSLAYLERFDRHLDNLPPDQLRRTFTALGVRLDVRFTLNLDPRSRRQRVPVGGTLIFGASGVAGNDAPPARAEGVSYIPVEESFGCGGRI